jgi:hypothetical protein
LPGVDDVLTYPAEWIDPNLRSVIRPEVMALVARLAELHMDAALILTSIDQSPLPMALPRLADVPRIGAISTGCASSLPDVRHPVHDDLHEVDAPLALAAAMGFHLPPGDAGRLQVTRRGHLPPDALALTPYIAVPPGASAPAPSLVAGAQDPQEAPGTVGHPASRLDRWLSSTSPQSRAASTAVVGAEDGARRDD